MRNISICRFSTLLYVICKCVTLSDSHRFNVPKQIIQPAFNYFL